MFHVLAKRITSNGGKLGFVLGLEIFSRVWSLYGGDKRVTPRQQAVNEGRGSSTFFQISEPV